jgi:hypothetical protein
MECSLTKLAVAGFGWKFGDSGGCGGGGVDSSGSLAVALTAAVAEAVCHKNTSVIIKIY